MQRKECGKDCFQIFLRINCCAKVEAFQSVMCGTEDNQATPWHFRGVHVLVINYMHLCAWMVDTTKAS